MLQKSALDDSLAVATVQLTPDPPCSHLNTSRLNADSTAVPTVCPAAQVWPNSIGECDKFVLAPERKFSAALMLHTMAVVLR